MLNETVYTPLGKGKVVYELPDGRLLVQFPYGGGQLFFPEEVFKPTPPTPSSPTFRLQAA